HGRLGSWCPPSSWDIQAATGSRVHSSPGGSYSYLWQPGLPRATAEADAYEAGGRKSCFSLFHRRRRRSPGLVGTVSWPLSSADVFPLCLLSDVQPASVRLWKGIPAPPGEGPVRRRLLSLPRSRDPEERRSAQPCVSAGRGSEPGDLSPLRSRNLLGRSPEVDGAAELLPRLVPLVPARFLGRGGQADGEDAGGLSRRPGRSPPPRPLRQRHRRPSLSRRRRDGAVSVVGPRRRRARLDGRPGRIGVRAAHT